MDSTDYTQNITVQYCFPGDNSSCRKVVQSGPGYLLLYIFLSCIPVCTVFLNLLVIISICHFRQLHTPTNLLILSLAVADLLMGLFVLPVKIMELIDSCWYLGKLACSISEIIIGLSMFASLFNLVFIAIDRYIAISDPLRYASRVTVSKMTVLLTLVWSFCLLYVIMFMYFNDHLTPSQMYTRCHGECVVFVKFSLHIIGIIFFIAPCSTILILYSLIFNVARRQAKAVKAFTNDDSHNVSSSSENKAAKTLGIVIFVYLACWIPFYISSIAVTDSNTLSMVWTVFGWLMFMNSSVNPLIYAIFYPWFRKSSKYIISCRIFEPFSSRINLYIEIFT